MSQQQSASQEPRMPIYVTGKMLEIILGGVSQLAFNVAAPVIKDIEAQYQAMEEQAKKQQEAKSAPEPVPEEVEAPDIITE